MPAAAAKPLLKADKCSLVEAPADKCSPAETPPKADKRTSAKPLVAKVGQRGVVIPVEEFRSKLGGDKIYRRVLSALTVTENFQPGRPRGMARVTRKAYQTFRDTAVRPSLEYLIVPRVKAAVFMRAPAKAATPLIDALHEADDAHRLPRRIEKERCEPAIPLYEYQEAAVAHLCGPKGALGPASVAAHRGVAYLRMDTGVGKSRVGCAVVAVRGEPALVVVPTQAIADQWVDEFAEIFPEMRAAVYHNQPKGSNRAPPGPETHDVVVIIVNTLRDKTPEFMSGYGTMLLDEAHEYHSAHNSRVLWLAQTRAVLGLSATPEDRADGLDKYVMQHLGPVIEPESIPGYDLGAVKFRGEVTVIDYAGHPAHCETAVTQSGTMSAIMTIGNVIKDPARLNLVAEQVVRLFNLHKTAEPDELLRLGLGPRPVECATPKHPAGEIRRHGVFVFAEHREYLPLLRECIGKLVDPGVLYVPQLGDADLVLGDFAESEPVSAAAAVAPAAVTPAATSIAAVVSPAAVVASTAAPKKQRDPEEAHSNISVLRGGVSRGDVSRARKAGAHIVLTTFGFSRRGISLPDMTAIVQATSRRNGQRQILGRFLRRGSDESILRQCIDIVDTRTGLRGQYADRRKVYTEKNYPITRLAAKWEDYATGTPLAAEIADSANGAQEDENPLSGMEADDLLDLALGRPGGVAEIGGEEGYAEEAGPKTCRRSREIEVAARGAPPKKGPKMPNLDADDLSELLGFEL
jgi:superfamily II DNA or RNA helicase